MSVLFRFGKYGYHQEKKRSFDAAFNLRVVEYAEQDTNRGAGRKFGVDEEL